MQVFANQFARAQQRVIMTLDRNQTIAGSILGGNVPGRCVAIAAAADRKAAALTQRIERKAAVGAEMLARGGFDRAGVSSMYWRRNSRNGRSPMKQMPVLSGLSNTGRPAQRARSRTCALV